MDNNYDENRNNGMNDENFGGQDRIYQTGEGLSESDRRAMEADNAGAGKPEKKKSPLKTCCIGAGIIGAVLLIVILVAGRILFEMVNEYVPFISQGIRGDGNVVTNTRELSEFTKVEINGMAEIQIIQSDKYEVEVSIDENLQQYVSAEVSNGTLSVSTMQRLNPSSGFNIKIYTKSLEELEVSGAVEADLKDIEGEELIIDISGAADVKANGKVKKLVIDSSGASSIDTSDLEAEDVRVSISGAGDARVNASGGLDASVSGAGSVKYKGDPENVKKDISGVGSVQAD